MIDILAELSWSHTVPLMIVALAIIFWKPIAERIRHLKSIRGQGSRYDILFQEPNPESLPAGGERTIEPSDVIEAFREIPDFTEEETKALMDPVYTHLRRNGIMTRKTLDSLVRSRETLDHLRNLYVTLLQRPKDKPLDPVAVASWGAILFRYGVRQDILTAVQKAIMNSDEFRQHVTASPEKPGSID
jgi:hypothetical protein